MQSVFTITCLPPFVCLLLPCLSPRSPEKDGFNTSTLLSLLSTPYSYFLLSPEYPEHRSTTVHFTTECVLLVCIFHQTECLREDTKIFVPLVPTQLEKLFDSPLFLPLLFLPCTPANPHFKDKNGNRKYTGRNFSLNPTSVTL